jgi:hypothetical protein
MPPPQVFGAGRPISREMLSRRGRRLFDIGAWIWLPCWLLAPLVVRVAIGAPWGPEFFLPFTIVALAPILLFVPGNRGPFRALYLQPTLRAILTDEGVELHLPGVGVHKHAWAEIASLRVVNGISPGMLVGTDGSVLDVIPGPLVRGLWTPFARAIVRRRPDRYRIVETGWLRRPLAFELIADARESR